MHQPMDKHEVSHQATAQVWSSRGEVTIAGNFAVLDAEERKDLFVTNAIYA